MAKKKVRKDSVVKKASRSLDRAGSSDLLLRVDSFLTKQLLKILVIALITFVIVAGLLFDGYIVPMADDANFIVEASDFLKYGKFPEFSSVFYTALLGIPAAIFGYSIVVYKLFSFLMGGLGLLGFYKSFKKRYPGSIVAFVLFFIASNYAIQFFSSSTLSESFFMAFQYLFLGVSFYLIDKLSLIDNEASELKSNWLLWLGLGLLLLFYSITKNILVIAPFLLALFFLYKKRNVLAAAIAGLYIGFRVLYSLFIKIVFDASSVSGQYSTLLLKDYYDPSKGKEDVFGLINRYITNFNHHISNDVLRVLGFRSEGVTLEPIGLISILFCALCLYALYRSFIRKLDYNLFLGLYLMSIMSVVFVALQTQWKQDRMVIVFIPLLFMFLLGVLHERVKKSSSTAQLGFLGMLCFLFFLQLRHLPPKISLNSPKLTAILSGDIYGTYTTDWKNYLKMSRWCSDNLPKTSKEMVRKPNTSIVYANGDKIFEGLFRSTQETGDKVLSDFQINGATHLMVCNLRLNPAMAVEGQVIGTTHSYLRAIYTYDPSKLRLLQTIGDSEPCNLYEIVY